MTGILRSVGFKQGRWLDTVFMQRSLGTGNTTLPVGLKQSQSEKDVLALVFPGRSFW
ncbi:Uncharacterised protein [Pantoea agglomerans]|uniref:Uncharacterized protein n=1 Tax=Enterobacter agglomerans TaxID=549 RepID=A0A379AHM7_ENTAG|nr:Uncharacterised protein [Pantoea agglomerans]